MGQSGDKKGRETYDPFKKPENNGTNPDGTPGGFGYPGGDGGRGGNGYGYTGGYGAGDHAQNDGSFYGPDYFTGRSGYGYAGGASGGYGYPGGAPTGAPATRSPGYRYAVASAILGGVALLLCLSVWVSLVTGVLAIVFSLLARKRDGKFTSASLAGLILGVVALVLVALIFTYLILHFDEVETILKEWLEEYAGQSPSGGNSGGSSGGNSGGSGTPDPSGGNGRQLAWLPLPRA